VITAFKGEEVNGPRDLTRRVAGTPPGTSASLRVTRDGQTRTVDVTLGELRDAEPRR
jgi:S1-C subfamily serine protease